MDAAVRKAASEERRLMQSLYDTEGTVGEGAFGVVLKAAVKTRAPAPADDGGDGDAGAAAAAAATTSAAGSSAGDAQQPQQPRQYVAIKKMLNHREGQGIPQDAYREIKVRTRMTGCCAVKQRCLVVSDGPSEHAPMGLPCFSVFCACNLIRY